MENINILNQLNNTNTWKNLTITPLDIDSIKVNAVVVEVKFNYIGQIRSIDGVHNVLGTGIDEGQVRATKKLFASDCFELKEMEAVERQIKDLISKYAANVPFKACCYLVAVDSYMLGDEKIQGTFLKKMYDELNELIEKWYRWVNEFIAKYPGIYQDAKIRNGSLFNEKDYYSPEKVQENPDLLRCKFRVSVRMYPFVDNSGLLSNISNNLAAKQTAMAKEENKLLALENREKVASFVADNLSKLLDNFNQDASGTKKRIRSEMVQGFQSFLKTFPAKNIAGDKDLSVFIGKLEALFRDETSKSLNELKKETLKAQQTAKDYKPSLLLDIEQGRQIALDLLEITSKQIEEVQKDENSNIAQAGRVFDF